MKFGKIQNDVAAQLMKARDLFGLCISASILSGCSVFMAASDRTGTDLGVASTGITRSEVERKLGAPVSSLTTPEGQWHTYQYVKPKEGSGGRAVAHGVMDVLTLGLWEVVGTPVEAVGDDKKGKVEVLFDASDKVVRSRILD